MFNEPLRIYKDYQILPEPTLSVSATNANEFYFKFLLRNFFIQFNNFKTNRDHHENRKETLKNVVGQIILGAHPKREY